MLYSFNEYIKIIITETGKCKTYHVALQCRYTIFVQKLRT